MREEILELFKNKEKMLVDLLAYIKKAHFAYVEDEADEFAVFVDNISVYVRALQKNQANIDAVDKKIYSTDKEVRETEQRCKELARQAYNIDKEINDKMTVVKEELRSKYTSSKNQQKFYDYTGNVGYISESFASFDTKQ